MPITATAYSFGELDEKAREKAIKAHRTAEVDYQGWWDGIYGVWWDKLSEHGYDVKDIFFSGFWNQGDGACFTGSLDVLKWLEHGDGSEQPSDNYSLRYWLRKLGSTAAQVSIGHFGHYYHRFSMQFHLEWEEWVVPPKAICQFMNLEKQIIEDARDLALELYRDLEKEYEYLTSDECVTEFLLDNEHILFWSDGSPAKD